MWILISILASALAATPTGMTDRPTASVPPARDGNIAILEELQAARASKRAEDYRLFIERHPEHPLAEVARAELAKLLAERE